MTGGLSPAYRRRHKYRKLKSNCMVGLTVLATVIALVPLFLVLGYLVSKGASSLNWDFFTKMPAPVGQSGGGMANAIVGTFELVGLAGLMGIPIGVGAGIYLVENRGRWLAQLVRFAADVMMGVPSIVIGIFVYAVLVRPLGGFSTLAGAVALAIIMIPLVTRTAEEMILLVPHELREAALALGVPRWRTTVSVVVRAADEWNRDRRYPRDCPGRGRDRAAAVYRFRQSVLVDLADAADLVIDRAGLHLCDFAVRGLAAAGVGRRLGVDRYRSCA